MVISNPLVSEKLEVVGYEFCWLNPTTSDQCRQNPVEGAVYLTECSLWATLQAYTLSTHVGHVQNLVMVLMSWNLA